MFDHCITVPTMKLQWIYLYSAAPRGKSDEEKNFLFRRSLINHLETFLFAWGKVFRCEEQETTTNIFTNLHKSCRLVSTFPMNLLSFVSLCVSSECVNIFQTARNHFPTMFEKNFNVLSKWTLLNAALADRIFHSTDIME